MSNKYTIIIRASLVCKGTIIVSIYLTNHYVLNTLIYSGIALLHNNQYIISKQSMVLWIEGYEAEKYSDILIKNGYANQNPYGLVLSLKGLLELI